MVVLRRQLEEVGREWEVEREKWREEAAARLADKDKVCSVDRAHGHSLMEGQINQTVLAIWQCCRKLHVVSCHP